MEFPEKSQGTTARVLGILVAVLGLAAVAVFVVRPIWTTYSRQDGAVERMFDEIDRQLETKRQSNPTTEADTPRFDTSPTVPTGTISTEELVEWCKGDGSRVTVFEPRSEEWMRDCAEQFEARQASDAAVRIHQTQLSDAEIAWCEQHAMEVFETAKSLAAESIHPDMEFLPNRAWVETFWLYESPEDYVQACSTAYGGGDN